MSNPVTLHCPHCGTKLKIKNRSLFGQSVKCPGCQKNFVLRDPNEPAPAATAAAAPAKPVPPPAFPDFSAFGEAAESDVPAIFSGNAGGKLSSASMPVFSAGPEPAAVSGPAFPASTAAPQVNSPGPLAGLSAMPPLGGADPIGSIRKQRKGAQWVNYLAFGIIAVAAIGMGAYFATRPKPIARPSASVARTESSGASAFDVDPNKPYSRMILESDSSRIAEFKPTNGKPIELLMMPSGVNMVIHLRPAQLWSDSYDYKVLRASLTDDVMRWLGDQIKALTMKDPAQIEELTIGVLLGARGTMPQYAVVVHLAQPEKLSSLIEMFPGKYVSDITTKPDFRMKADDQHAYLIRDDRTYAICPATSASDLEYSLTIPNQDVSMGMSELLKRTDRQRLFTVVADLNDLNIHLGTLLPAPAQPFFRALSDWLGEDVEMVNWSIQPEPYFHSELVVRPVTTKEVASLETELKSRLEQLPEQVWKEICAKMQPREMRFRKLIGRLPAMLAAFQESTVSQRENRSVVLTTVLPAKATPNLALATLFTIDEASRTNFATAVAATQGMKPKLPETVVERLNLLVDSEFARTPLEQALTYLCGEIQVKLEIDGDALKNAGYTKNMPQTFNLGKVPMKRALFEIVKAYQEKGKEMVISIDESTKTIHVLTLVAAEAKGMKVFPLTAE